MKTIRLNETNLRALVTKSVKNILKEGLEVWKDGGQAENLAKQIFVDFKDAAAYGVTKIQKTYSYHLDDYDVPITVKLETNGNTQGWWIQKSKSIEMFIGGHIALQLNEIRKILFHELTHAYDFLRRKEGKGLDSQYYAQQPGVTLNKRDTKLTKQINDIIYLLYTPTEVNAWQNVVVNGQKGIDRYINRINKQLDDLENNNRLKHEEIVYAYFVPKLLKIKHSPQTGREFTGWEYKRMFLNDARKRVERLKRRLYKNLAHYQGYANDNLEGFEKDAHVEGQAVDAYLQNHSIESMFCEAVVERIEDIAYEIVKNINVRLQYDWQTGMDSHPVFSIDVYSPSTDDYAFTIKVKPYKNRWPKTGWNPKTKCLEICSLLVMNYVYKAQRSNPQYWWDEEVKAAMRAICNAAPKNWNLKEIINDSYGMDIMREMSS